MQKRKNSAPRLARDIKTPLGLGCPDLACSPPGRKPDGQVCGKGARADRYATCATGHGMHAGRAEQYAGTRRAPRTVGHHTPHDAQRGGEGTPVRAASCSVVPCNRGDVFWSCVRFVNANVVRDVGGLLQLPPARRGGAAPCPAGRGGRRAGPPAAGPPYGDGR